MRANMLLMTHALVGATAFTTSRLQCKSMPSRTEPQSATRNCFHQNLVLHERCSEKKRPSRRMDSVSRHMSSLGDDHKEDHFKEMLPDFKLPPSPENFLVLGGDVVALFLYSFLDHFLNAMYNSMLKDAGSDAIFGLHASWIDALHMPAAFISQQMPVPITYAPALDYAGICSVLFTTFWLVSGYFNEAFSYKNTILCDTTRAISVAGRTWVFAALAMVMLAYGSDIFGSSLQTKVGGLTQADADFIFDSLAVLVSWRFMMAYMLGKW